MRLPAAIIRTVRLILDLGANIECASAYFLSAFPDASVIAVEPDPENTARCRDNLRPYGDRVSVIRGAVWHSGGELVLSREHGKEWAVQVRQAKPGENADTIAYSVPDLLKTSHLQQIDLLKIDIEGSELALFSRNTEPWLGTVKNICVELHGTECESVFLKALENFQYEASRLGEHLLCLNLSSKRTLGPKA
ncbi:MAG TPA: FkbM family methyltransferase [Acidobacteriaceae bacterium]|nr:FkbM family methyltransferase [Acidobacteriaceae bacterium]